MNSVRTKNLSLKYNWLTPLGFKDIGNRKFEYVAKTQLLLFLYLPLPAVDLRIL